MEIMLVHISPNGLVDAGKALIAPSHIVAVTEGKLGTSVITLSTGQKFEVRPPYEAIKKMLGARNAQGI